MNRYMNINAIVLMTSLSNIAFLHRLPLYVFCCKYNRFLWLSMGNILFLIQNEMFLILFCDIIVFYVVLYVVPRNVMINPINPNLTNQ